MDIIITQIINNKSNSFGYNYILLPRELSLERHIGIWTGKVKQVQIQQKWCPFNLHAPYPCRSTWTRLLVFTLTDSCEAVNWFYLLEKQTKGFVHDHIVNL